MADITRFTPMELIPNIFQVNRLSCQAIFFQAKTHIHTNYRFEYQTSIKSLPHFFLPNYFSFKASPQNQSLILEKTHLQIVFAFSRDGHALSKNHYDLHVKGY